MPGPLPDLGATLAASFGAGGRPRLFHAPGRVNVIGAHIDYSGGPVLTASIDLGVTVAARLSSDGRWRLASRQSPERFDGPADTLPEKAPPSWLAYPLGVLATLRGQGHQPPPLEALVSGTVPIGAGLSSSAALLVAFAGAASAMGGRHLDRADLADVAFRAETEYVGVKVGRQDQMAAALGEPGAFLYIDFKTMRWEPIPLPAERIALVVLDSGKRRELTAGRFNVRVEETRRALGILRESIPSLGCLADLTPGDLARYATRLDATAHRRVRHVVSEVARVKACREALLSGDLLAAGREMAFSHASSRLDYETSTPELDCLQDAAMRCDAVFGARLTGGGFGGCVLALCRAGGEDALTSTVAEAYERSFGLRPQTHVLGLGVGYHEVLPGQG